MSTILRMTRSVAVILALAISICAQGKVPAPADHELHPVWGGETWAVYSHLADDGLHMWTGEDGGRIRVSHDGGATWQFADTPDTFTGSIFDIKFYDDGKHGFAVGRGGWVLESVDYGDTWSYYGTQVLDPNGEPATLWGVRDMGNGITFVSGLWTFRYTVNGGQTWIDFNVYDRHPAQAGAQLINPGDLELFRIDVVGSLGAFRGIVGAEWELPAGGHGVVIYTDAADSAASLGRNWWITLDDTTVPPSASGAVMLQPWSARYTRGATNPSTATGWVVGGRGGNNPSRWYRTADGGATWTLDGESSVTLYDVASEANGNAMFAGYSGRYGVRNPATGAWTESVMPCNSPYFPTIGEHTGALLGAHSYGADAFLLVGDFGAQRVSVDYGANWASISDFYPNTDELEQRLADVFFFPQAPATGFVVGQLGRILRTTDGGCNWTPVEPTLPAPSLNAIDFRNATSGVAVGDNGLAYRSTDGGLNWATGTIAPLSGFSTNTFTLRAVDTVGPSEAWAVGNASQNRPIVVYTRDGGSGWFQLPAPAVTNMTLTGVAFANPGEGIVVGYSVSGGVPSARAFRASFNGVTVTWTEITPAGLGSGTALLDVAASGANLASATAVAVGTDGLVLEWSGAAFAAASISGQLATDLTAVDVSPSGNTVLVGANYDIDLSVADDKGFMWRRDATGWAKIRSFTGKDITGISLTSDTGGFVAGQPASLGNPESASFIHGNLASSIVIEYVAN